MHHVLVVSKWTYHDSHLVVSVGVEGPSKRAQPATVRASEVLSLLAVVKDFPAHELFVASDGGDAENLPHLAVSIFAFEFHGLFYIYLASARDSGVAEVFGLLELQRAELEVALLLVSLAEEKVTVAPEVALRTFPLQVWNCGILEEKRIIFVKDELVSLLHSLQDGFLSVKSELGGNAIPKAQMIVHVQLEENVAGRLNKLTTEALFV